MEFLKRIFYNFEERRLRSPFRFIIFVTIFFLLLMIVEIISAPIKNNFDYPKLISIPLSFVFFCLSLWLSGRLFDKRNFSDYGIFFSREWIRDLFYGLFMGIFLISFVFLFEYLQGWITIEKTFFVAGEKNFTLRMIESVLLYIYVGFYEEAFSRGYMIKNFSEGMNFKNTGQAFAVIFAVLFTSFLFGLGHAGNPNSTFIAWWNIIIIGVLLGYTFVVTKSLAIPIGIHITWNFFQGAVFGFPVSGNPVTVTFLKIEQSGNPLWTGESFGPEAGLVIYFVAFLWLILLHIWLRLNKRSEKVNYNFAEYVSNTSD